MFASNGIVIGIALWEKWDVSVLMWIYWAQSVMIGIEYFVKLRSLKSFTTDGLKINGQTVEPERKVLRKISLFFLIHYGLFHLVYFAFLTGLWEPPVDAIPGMCVCIFIFAAHQFLSLWRSWKEEMNTGQNIGHVMQEPYPRIIPMHLTIIFGSFLIRGRGTLLFFLVLKTLADLVMEMRSQQYPVK